MVDPHIETESSYMLCLMIRNESKNAYDTIMDVYTNQPTPPVRTLVLDTLSNDDTCEWLLKIEPQPIVIQEAFVDFAWSRNRLLVHAQHFGEEPIVMIDCDDRVGFDIGKAVAACNQKAHEATPFMIPWCMLTPHKFRFQEHTAQFYNINIIADRNAYFKYPMHETLMRNSLILKPDLTPVSDREPSINQDRSTAHRHRDPHDDVAIIEKWIDENPEEDPGRMLFYLGRTYLAFDHDKAFEILMKRVTLGGNNYEELAWSLFELGRIAFFRNNFEDAITLLEESHKLFSDEQFRGPGAESIPIVLQYLCMSYGERAFELDLEGANSKKMWKQTNKYMQLAETCPTPKNQITVIDSDRRVFAIN